MPKKCAVAQVEHVGHILKIRMLGSQNKTKHNSKQSNVFEVLLCFALLCFALLYFANKPRALKELNITSKTLVDSRDLYVRWFLQMF
jgi:hypothetical protein